MKATTLVLLLCFLSFACTKKSTTSSNTQPLQVSQVPQRSDPQNLGDLDDGTADPFVPPVVIPTPTIPNNLNQFCGTLFTDFYDSKPRFLIDTETIAYVLRTDIYELEQVISRLIYPSDSQRVCIDGLKTAAVASATSDTFLDGYIITVEDDAILHPNRPEEAVFGFELCGSFRFVTEPGGAQYIEANSGNVFYIVNNINLSAVPNFSELAMDPAFVVKGCMYSDTAPYNNFAVTFKKYFDAEALNFGTLEVEVPVF